MISNQKVEDSKQIFESLNGFRGLLAFFVLMHHASYDMGLKSDYNLFKGAGYYIGVLGFFVLSAFLLTHRLIIDMENAKSTKETVIACVIYTIRRFFRIYVPYFIFCIILKSKQNILGGYFTNYSTFFELVTLQTVGFNHLWTIANEVKYYFFIPFICIGYVKIPKLAYISSLIALFIIVKFFNLFQLTDELYSVKNRHVLRPRFLIFLSGSIAAMIYLQVYKKITDMHSKILNIVNICLVLYFPYKFLQYLNPKVSVFHDSIFCGIYLSVIILFLVLGSSNSIIAKFLSNSNLLCMYGQYSFGIYLFHPGVILINKIIKTKTSFEIVTIINVISFFLGFLFHYLIEKPSIKMGNYIIKQSNLKA